VLYVAQGAATILLAVMIAAVIFLLFQLAAILLGMFV
jgi:hypothetical protein